MDNIQPSPLIRSMERRISLRYLEISHPPLELQQKKCVTALTAAVACGQGFSQPASNLFLLYAHSTSTGGSVNNIGSSPTVIIYCSPPFREE